ncbi:hypothetical protein EDWATA_02413 [Edwardsiella tarda ATCC 23685]|uniref:Uncharacterized protein n=1 Tax=Edwardsiella tarda ATCC 23685 TaxID=500638 RepID=D4F6N2_EDWTA|nr:hypothetical protein EDWATA_02413 [Edwardsiella tarda ATCC 23685]
MKCHPAGEAGKRSRAIGDGAPARADTRLRLAEGKRYFPRILALLPPIYP